MPNHLIHIGFPKTGSTFLQEWFRLHPQIHYAHGGIGGFYTVYEMSRLAAKQKDLGIKYFVTSDEGLSVPNALIGTTINSDNVNLADLMSKEQAQKNACEILKSLFPSGKILLVTRGFKAVVASGYAEYIRHGGTMSILDMANNFSGEGQVFNYSFSIDLYEAAFGKENVIVLPYELLKENQVEFLSILEQRLEITKLEHSIGRINESFTPSEMYWYPRMSSLISRISRRLGTKAYNVIFRRYVNKLSHNKLKKIVNLIDRIKPGRTFNAADISPELLDYFRRKNDEGGCGARLRGNPLYAPYLSEYLLD